MSLQMEKRGEQPHAGLCNLPKRPCQRKIYPSTLHSTKQCPVFWGHAKAGWCDAGDGLRVARHQANRVEVLGCVLVAAERVLHG